MSFGEVLRRLREKAGLTQAGLAEESGVSLRSIQGWEQDYRCPVSPDFFRITKALGASADEFSKIASEPAREKPKTKPGKEDLKAAAKKTQRQDRKK